jgi:hypothetical protein
MAAPGAPHSRNSMPAAVYRGSKKRIAQLSPFEELPANFWLVVAIAAVMLAITAAIIYGAVLHP